MQRKREAEFQARLDAIQKKMEKMGGTFDDAKKEEEREERRIIALQKEKTGVTLKSNVKSVTR